MVTDIPLPGGAVNQVVRIGDTVHRPVGPHSEYVHRLLVLLEQQGWAGAPRFLGVDAAGREILTFLDGHVPWPEGQAQVVRDEAGLTAVALLVREFHDLTAGTELAGDQEVACHNDLAPKNTVYRNADGGLWPVAFIDWDLAGPGARIHDVAHLCWQYLGLGPDSIDAGEASRLMRLVCDAYELRDRDGLVETVLWWQDRCWRGIETAAAEGDPAMVRLRDGGASRAVRAAHDWVLERRLPLEAAL